MTMSGRVTNIDQLAINKRDKVCHYFASSKKLGGGSPGAPSITPSLSQSRSEDEDSCEHELKTASSGRDHDIEPIAIEFSGKSTVEPVTGIEYPQCLNEYKQFIGCGVRTKYLFFHAYAVGVYLNIEHSLLKSIKTDCDIDKVLLNPNYPRVLRLVLNRDVTSNQYIGATFDALLPLMRAKDLDK